MKLIINKEPEVKTITLEKAMMELHTFIAAYRAANSDAYCILSQYTPHSDVKRYTHANFGFVPLNGASGSRFNANTLKESLELASKSRKVYIFNTMQEMLKAISTQCKKC